MSDFKRPMTDFSGNQWILIHIVCLLFFFPALVASIVLHMLQVNCERHNEEVHRQNMAYDAKRRADSLSREEGVSQP